jgi:hypothetical protein
MPWDIRTAYIRFWNENLRGNIDKDGKIIFMWISAEREEHLWNEQHLLSIGAFGKMVIKF